MDKLKYYTLKAMFYRLPKKVKDAMCEWETPCATNDCDDNKEESLLNDLRAQRFILDHYTNEGLLFYMQQVAELHIDEQIYKKKFPFDYDGRLEVNWSEFFLGGTDVEPVDITEKEWFNNFENE